MIIPDMEPSLAALPQSFKELIEARAVLLKECGWQRRDVPNAVGSYRWMHSRDNAEYVDENNRKQTRYHLHPETFAYYSVDLHIRVTGNQTDKQKELHNLVSKAEEKYLLENNWIRNPNENDQHLGAGHKVSWRDPEGPPQKWIGQSDAANLLIYKQYEALWEEFDSKL